MTSRLIQELSFKDFINNYETIYVPFMNHV